MTHDRREIIIPKEDAVFWMDGNGRWHNRYGEFEHKKVVSYFNRSIGYDADGYFVSQVREGALEKVYFKYQETALFVVDILGDNDDLQLLLNTGKRILLEPKKLFIKNDGLFMHVENQLVKFTDRGMMKISGLMEEIGGRFFIKLHERQFKIES